MLEIYGVNHNSQIEEVRLKKSKDQTLTLEEFINKANKIHDNKYDYSLTIYIATREKIKIICPIHGEFLQSPNNHLSPSGCPSCASGRYSQTALDWLNYISNNYKNEIQHIENKGEYQINISNKKFIKVDGYCKETNTVYEFLGDYWHGNPEKYLAEDINPTTKKSFGDCYQETMERLELIKSLGYNLEYIWESDWNKIKKTL